MSFIGPKMMEKFDQRLQEAFLANSQIPFTDSYIIVFGDLAQLPPVKDIPMYASNSYEGML